MVFLWRMVTLGFGVFDNTLKSLAHAKERSYDPTVAVGNTLASSKAMFRSTTVIYCSSTAPMSIPLPAILLRPR